MDIKLQILSCHRMHRIAKHKSLSGEVELPKIKISEIKQ